MRGLPLSSRAPPPKQRMLPFTRVVVVLTAFVGLAMLIQNRAISKNTSYLDTAPKDLPLSETSPMLSEDAVPIDSQHRDTETVCRVGRMNAVLVKTQRYTAPASHPRPAMGSLDLYKDSETCTTYSGRYGLYDDASLGSTYLHAYRVPPSPPPHKFGDGDRIAEELLQANDGTINSGDDHSFFDWGAAVASCHAGQPAARRALVLRSHENYTWGHDDIRNVRALIAELALNASPTERYDVHLLVDIHRRNVSFASSDGQRQRVLRTSVPREFWSITTLWSEEQMQWLYPGLPGRFLNGMSAVSSYRSCFMPLQVFARQHEDKYDYVWNWEMDIRSTHDYAQMLKDVEAYSRGAKVDPLLQRQSEWRIPARNINADERSDNQEADLITLNPIFNATDTGWYWENDFQNLPANTERRASIGRNVRLSRRLLQAMNTANVDAKQSAHCESWPATVLVQQQQQQQQASQSQPSAPLWKGVYVPHPIYTRHEWPAERLAVRVNRHDVYRKVNERAALRDVSFYADGAHAGDIYNAWRTGPRVCRLPALLHYVKYQP